VKSSFINKIILCKHCRHAFIIHEQGSEDTCDGCLAEFEIRGKLVDEFKNENDSAPDVSR
jgi:uncharacterized CHY-type Zn-finger protein